MDSFLEYLAARLQEPSTWVSLGTLGTAIGWKIAPQYWETIALVGMGAGGAIGTFLRERKKTTAIEIKNVVEAVVKSEVTKPVSTATLEAAMKNGN